MSNNTKIEHHDEFETEIIKKYKNNLINNETHYRAQLKNESKHDYILYLKGLNGGNIHNKQTFNNKTNKQSFAYVASVIIACILFFLFVLEILSVFFLTTGLTIISLFLFLIVFVLCLISLLTQKQNTIGKISSIFLMICFAIYMILFGIFLGAPFLYWAPYYIYGQSVMISSIILLGVLVLSELTTAILYLVSSTKIAKQ